MKPDVTIYHNPRCSKSRQTLALLREHGIEPEIREYLKNPPGAKAIRALLKRLGLRAVVLGDVGCRSRKLFDGRSAPA